MSGEVLALGLLSAVRGVSLAIVYALLRSGRPRRLLATYVVSGAAVTVGVGAVVVTVLQPGAGSEEAATGRLVVDLVLGLAALGYALARALGWGPRRRDDRDGVLRGTLARRLRAPTVPVVAAAGVVTNLPGLYFLAALVAILQTHPTPAGGIGQVLVYTLLRFAVPIVALGVAVARPDDLARRVRVVHDWGRRHERVLLPALVGAVGVYLVVKALRGLLA